MRAAAVLALCLATFAASSATAEPAAGSKADAARELLLGRWRLNPELSEDALQRLREAGSWRRAGDWTAGSMGRPGRGVGEIFGRAPARGEDPDAARLQDENEVRQFAFANSATIWVESLRPRILVRQDQGLTRSFDPDGKRRETDNGEQKARWDGERLVVQTKLPVGDVRERWRVSRQPRRLTIELTIERAAGPSVKLKRVYDPEPAASP